MPNKRVNKWEKRSSSYLCRGNPVLPPVFLFYSHATDTATQNTSSHRMCGGFSPHQQTAPNSCVVCGGGRSSPTSPSKAQNISRGACNLTQFWHHLPRESIRFHRLGVQAYKTASPLPHQTGGYLCFWPTGYRLEAPMTPSLFVILQAEVQVVTCISDCYKSEVPTTPVLGFN